MYMANIINLITIKRAIALLTIAVFILSDLSFAADSSTLAVAKVADSDFSADSIDRQAAIALQICLNQINAKQNIALSHDASAIRTIYEKFIKPTIKPNQPVIPGFNNLELVSDTYLIYLIPVSVMVKGQREDRYLFFSTDTKGIGKFPIFVCKLDERQRYIDLARSGDLVKDMKPAGETPSMKAKELPITSIHKMVLLTQREEGTEVAPENLATVMFYINSEIMPLLGRIPNDEQNAKDRQRKVFDTVCRILLGEELRAGHAVKGYRYLGIALSGLKKYIPKAGEKRDYSKIRNKIGNRRLTDNFGRRRLPKRWEQDLMMLAFTETAQHEMSIHGPMRDEHKRHTKVTHHKPDAPSMKAVEPANIMVDVEAMYEKVRARYPQRDVSFFNKMTLWALKAGSLDRAVSIYEEVIAKHATQSASPAALMPFLDNMTTWAVTAGSLAKAGAIHNEVMAKCQGIEFGFVEKMTLWAVTAGSFEKARALRSEVLASSKDMLIPAKYAASFLDNLTLIAVITGDVKKAIDIRTEVADKWYRGYPEEFIGKMVLWSAIAGGIINAHGIREEVLKRYRIENMVEADRAVFLDRMTLWAVTAYRQSAAATAERGRTPSMVADGRHWRGAIGPDTDIAASATTGTVSPFEEARLALPLEYEANRMDVGALSDELLDAGLGRSLDISDKKLFVFSEKVTFEAGLGILLPKLASSGIRVAVVATNDRERALIEELNAGKPKEQRVIYRDSVTDIVTSQHAVRYYYFRMEGDPDFNYGGLISMDITKIVKRIIEALGRVNGVVDPSKLQQLHEASRKFAQAA
jgi:hypothetical protein